MTRKSNQDSRSLMKEIKRRTYKKYSSEEKIRIVIEGLRVYDVS